MCSTFRKTDTDDAASIIDEKQVRASARQRSQRLRRVTFSSSLS